MALKEIINYKKSKLLQKKKLVDQEKTRVKKSDRSLADALRKNSCAYICEVKYASPSKGKIREFIDPENIAKIYQPFANAISVLACEKFFSGSPEYVKRVRQQVECPVLFKDIIISPIQVYEARIFEADAVLLMLSVLNDSDYLECAKVAEELSLDIICEVHDEEELERALKLNAKIIGINNRNLKNLQVDLLTTKNLAKKIPKGCQVISESGFYEHDQIKEYRSQVDGFLVGTSLMEQERIDLALRQLIFSRVKICGLTSNQDAKAAYNLGAFYGGLNFYRDSKRFIDIEQAKKIIKDVPLIFGGVFVNESIDKILQTVETLGLKFVQIHGDEDEKFLTQLKKQLPNGVELWQVQRISESIEKFHQIGDRVLFDCFDKNFGGSGKQFDWGLLRSLTKDSEFILAGGLNPKNIVRAQDTNAFVLDIASGVEESPRKKSRVLMQELFNNLRGSK